MDGRLVPAWNMPGNTEPAGSAPRAPPVVPNSPCTVGLRTHGTHVRRPRRVRVDVPDWRALRRTRRHARADDQNAHGCRRDGL